MKKANDEIHVFVSSGVSAAFRCKEKIPFSALEADESDSDVTFTGSLELISEVYRDSVNVAFGTRGKKRTRMGNTPRLRPRSKKAPTLAERKYGKKPKAKRTPNATGSVKLAPFIDLMNDWHNGIGPQESMRHLLWEYSEGNKSLVTRLKKLGAQVVVRKFQLTSLCQPITVRGESGSCFHTSGDMDTVGDVADGIGVRLGLLTEMPLPPPRDGQSKWRPLEDEMNYFAVKRRSKRRRLNGN